MKPVNVKRKKWETADRISDAIVDVVNSELARMKRHGKIEPLELLAGQLLALKALQATMPLFGLPGSLAALYGQADAVLADMLNENAAAEVNR